MTDGDDDPDGSGASARAPAYLPPLSQVIVEKVCELHELADLYDSPELRRMARAGMRQRSGPRPINDDSKLADIAALLADGKAGCFHAAAKTVVRADGKIPVGKRKKVIERLRRKWNKIQKTVHAFV
ncbi:hypothetical protein HHL25_02925 [Rhizobium sp. S-51]|uniref:Uncharacterized protein n=1 Tax=Rhizobium terricola TaxID=2728849 RepID=A0A7Y0AT86_9HYPH|nr:hypothetical protein [Rhizobium terricola]NML73072.1 hypothetical protein [Rhizobium terricola]